MKFLAEISKPQYQAEFTKYITYGPTNKKAYELGTIEESYAKKLPSYPANAAKQLRDRSRLVHQVRGPGLGCVPEHADRMSRRAGAWRGSCKASRDMARGASLPIALRQIAKAYGAVHALDHVDLDIHSGEFLTLLGPSGSGKTTLLMVLAGFIRPDSGSLKFGDAEVIRLAPHKRDVGMVFQNYALFPHMNVAANIAFPLRLRGVAKADIARRVEAALETVQLGGYGARRVDQLSGGQRQRVALARAIVFEPRILLMDEPLSALDKQLREHMQIELRRLHEKLGMTTVYVTHDQREALTMSDRVAVINRGRIVQLDTPRALYEQPRKPLRRRVHRRVDVPAGRGLGATASSVRASD